MKTRGDYVRCLAVVLLLGLLSQVASAQTAIVEGIVRDRAGAPLVGAQVEILRDGERLRRVVTDASGRFQIGASVRQPGAYVLRVSAVGFAPTDVPLQREPGRLRANPGPFHIEGTVAIRSETATPGGDPKPIPRSIDPDPAPPPVAPGLPGGRTPTANPPLALDPYVVPVFYATDRARTQEEPLNYGGERNPTARLHLGRIDVRIPRDHRMGYVERPTIWTLWRENPETSMVMVTRRQLSYEDFYADVSRTVARSAEKEAFVFIHGYNVAFADAVYRTAQLSYDLGFDGAAVLYSWPSVCRTVDYRIDERNNEWTVTHLRWFLEDLRRRSGAGVIHLIAHSMGNRALAGALSRMTALPGVANFRQVVLTAPDIDAGLFPEIAEALGRVAGRVTLYASNRDRALEAARKYDTFQRVGSTRPSLVLVAGVDTIDASTVDTSLLGHSYFGDNTSVLSDLYYVLKGANTRRRAMIEQRGAPPKIWWAFRR